VAKTERLEADAATVHELFSAEKDFKAPIFQRLFVWGDTEANQLWDDLDQVVDGLDSSRFLGAIVLQDRSSKLAFAPRSYWIIDGQQRLTTLFLLLAAIADAARKAKLTSLAEQIATGYLLNQQGSYASTPKVQPTNRDLAQFARVLDRIAWASPTPQVGYGAEKGALLSMYTRVARQVAERVRLYSPSYLERLATAILENLKFVLIALSADEDPHQVFDSLNNRGQRLEIIDLVRNEVFQKFGEDYAGAEKLYNTRWRSFEDSLGDRLPDYFFPFTLIKRPTTTKSGTFGVLKDVWKTESPDAVLDNLLDYVPAFKAIATGESLEVSNELRSAIIRLLRMPAPSVVYPFTMRVIRQALRRELDEGIAAGNLRLVESFLVRRAFAGFEPTGLHAVFKGLWNDTQGEPAKFISTIDKNPTITFPSDDEFVQSVQANQLYYRKLAPYVLWEYERGLLGGDPIPLGIPLTIDHVMPQDRTKEWADVVSQKDHEDLLHTWANLTPLSNPLNAQKGHRSWEEVRAVLKTETVFKSTKRLAEAYETWDADSIRKRAEELAAWAVQRWPKAP
jgi:hypothetical protein